MTFGEQKNMNAETFVEQAKAKQPAGHTVERAVTMEPILKIENLCVEYRNRGPGQSVKRAVNRLNLSVQPGEVFGFLGPNGAGKTTTMNVLLGFIQATSGDARLFGTSVREPIARQRIGYLPELTYYYKFLSAEELRCVFMPASLRYRGARLSGGLTRY